MESQSEYEPLDGAVPPINAAAPTTPGLGGTYDPNAMVRPAQEAVDAQVATQGRPSATTVAVTVQPTQVRRPWRATVRTAFQFVLALALVLPFVVEATGLDPEVYPWLGVILAVGAGITRVMAVPQVEAFLRRFLPFLAAAPRLK
jgi:hypothetical protein